MKPLTDLEIEAGWHTTFSTSNPFCPCNLPTFTKAVRWAERHLQFRVAIALPKPEQSAHDTAAFARLTRALGRPTTVETIANETINGALVRMAAGRLEPITPSGEDYHSKGYRLARELAGHLSTRPKG